MRNETKSSPIVLVICTKEEKKMKRVGRYEMLKEYSTEMTLV